MAREIVITSVPRGVKLGRTGFQVAMQTAGLRDDLSAVLEKMAAYRHLPPGSGPNPVCWFHRIARTVAGQVHVVGRIGDAGVDFSNRSNKLAHMVVLDPADVGQVAHSSPAALLAAVEGRLATTWTANPEERQVPFSLTGIPASQAAACQTWRQVLGDAGWAGVVADRAIHQQPTLLIAADSSPTSCRRMLTLFAEALAVVPAAKRWAITFDTTTLAPDGILWRGTYAGSPESHASQPGLLVIDLLRPQPIPATMASGEFVQIARHGPPKAPVLAATPGQRPGAPPPPAILPPIPGGPQPPAPINVGPLTSRSRDDDDWEDVPIGRPRGGLGRTLFRAGIVLAAIAILGGVAATLVVGLRRPAVGRVDGVDMPVGKRPERKPEQNPPPKPDEQSQAKPPPPRQPRPAPQPEAKPPEVPSPPVRPPTPTLPDVRELAFGQLQKAIREEKRADRTLWPPPIDLFAAISDLEFDLVVGSNPFCPAEAVRAEDGVGWQIVIAEKALASIRRTPAGLHYAPEPSTADGGRYERFLKFMPLVFKRPSRPPEPEDWMVLAQPTVAQLAGKESLYDLLQGDGEALLPTGFDWQAPGTVTWRPRTIPVEGSPLTVAIMPLDDHRLRVEVVAKIGDRPFALTESLTIAPQEGTIRRNGRAWADRRTRLARISKTAPQSEAELLGYRDGKFGDIPGGRAISVVAALLEGLVDTPTAVKHAKPLLEACGVTEAADDRANVTLEDLRTAIRDGLAGMSGSFLQWTRKAYESSGRQAEDLKVFRPPSREPREKDEAYASRVEQLRTDFQQKKLAERVLAATGDAEALRAFLAATAGGDAPAATPKPGAAPDPEIAAISVLLELDGMIVAKVLENELLATLQRVPIAALFDGTVVLAWEVPESEPVTVTIAKIRPAAGLPPPSPPASAAPTPADVQP
ncbi:MAG: hypothetical protein FJ284_06205 [Planctomycetes bacterium]|nr:hypothetical protein [Planctomycetota bacterium]